MPQISSVAVRYPAIKIAELDKDHLQLAFIFPLIYGPFFPRRTYDSILKNDNKSRGFRWLLLHLGLDVRSSYLIKLSIFKSEKTEVSANIFNVKQIGILLGLHVSAIGNYFVETANRFINCFVSLRLMYFYICMFQVPKREKQA